MASEVKEHMILSTVEVREILPLIVDKKIPLQRMKNDGSFSFIPPKDFDNYLKSLDMNFYIDKTVYNAKVVKKTTVIAAKNDYEMPDYKFEKKVIKERKPFQEDKVYADIMSESKQMSKMDRLVVVRHNNHKMVRMMENGIKLDSSTMSETEKLFTSTLCINKASLEEDIDNDEDSGFLKRLVSETNQQVINLIDLMTKGKSTFRDLANLENIQTGSETLNHMNRILIRYISFMFFYNSYFQRYSNEIKKMRAYFDRKFAPYYNKVTKETQRLSLEIVFKQGIMPVREKQLFVDFCLGGFLHDIGKIPNIQYHDEEDQYDPSKVVRHVFDGYNMLVKSKLFSWGVVSASLLHHDYYGSNIGFKQNKTFTSKFVDKRESSRSMEYTKSFITYNILDVAYNNAFTYFPNKVLEIIDIFDSLQGKDDGEEKDVEIILQTIKEKYLNDKELGIDPILFNIYVDFLSVSGFIKNPNAIEGVKV